MEAASLLDTLPQALDESTREAAPSEGLYIAHQIP
jgi:hypothetical protein